MFSLSGQLPLEYTIINNYFISTTLTHSSNHCRCEPEGMIKVPVVLVVVNIPSLVQNTCVRGEFDKVLLAHVVPSFVAFLYALIKIVLFSIILFLQRAKHEGTDRQVEYQCKQ